METAWAAMERARMDQARLQRQVVFPSPSTSASWRVLPMASVPEAQRSGNDAQDVLAALAELREGHECIEALLRQLLEGREE